MVDPVSLAAVALLGFPVSAQPSLRVLDRHPLVVRGEGFRAGERVTVTALTGLGPRVVGTTAARGTFRVTFRLPAEPCAGARAVRAHGSLGSVAVKTIGPGTCTPPPRD